MAAGVQVTPGAAPASTTPDAVQASERTGRAPGASGGAVPLSPGEALACFTCQAVAVINCIHVAGRHLQ